MSDEETGGRKVSTEEGTKLAQRHGILFKEVSAKDGTNLNDAFQELMQSKLECNNRNL